MYVLHCQNFKLILQSLPNIFPTVFFCVQLCNVKCILIPYLQLRRASVPMLQIKLSNTRLSSAKYVVLIWTYQDVKLKNVKTSRLSKSLRARRQFLPCSLHQFLPAPNQNIWNASDPPSTPGVGLFVSELLSEPVLHPPGGIISLALTRTPRVQNKKWQCLLQKELIVIG